MSDGVKPLTPAQLATQEAQTAAEGYLKRNLIGVDDLCNGILGGKNDETISARCGRDAAKGYRVGILVAKFLNLFQRNHCAKAQAGDMERAMAVIAAEKSSGNLPHA
jgi:hypothetical protein